MTVNYNRLWKKLIDLDMSKSQLREKAGITSPSLCRYLDGSREPKATVLFKLCECLNIDIYDLFANDPETLESKRLNLISREETINMIKELADYHTGDAFNADRVISNIKQLKKHTIGGWILCKDALPDPPKVFEMGKVVLGLIRTPLGHDLGLFRFVDGQFGNFETDGAGVFRFIPLESPFKAEFEFKVIAWMKIPDLSGTLER